MVSIVIPSFNRCRLLERAIQSVLRQSMPDWQLIVVDDGSTDETEGRIRRFSDPRIEYVRQGRKGVSCARNRGIRLARYPWIAFLDSDDEWLPHKLERQVRAIEGEPAMGCVHTNEIWIRRGKRVNQGKKHRKYGGWIYDRCLPLCAVSPSSIMLRKSLLLEAGCFDESFPVCEDYELWLRLSSRVPFLFVEEPLIVKYGGHEDQLSRTHWGMDRFRIRAMLKALDSGKLTFQQWTWTVAEIVRKSGILITGSQKRGKQDQVACYRSLVDEVTGRKWSRNS